MVTVTGPSPATIGAYVGVGEGSWVAAEEAAVVAAVVAATVAAGALVAAVVAAGGLVGWGALVGADDAVVAAGGGAWVGATGGAAVGAQAAATSNRPATPSIFRAVRQGVKIVLMCFFSFFKQGLFTSIRIMVGY